MFEKLFMLVKSNAGKAVIENPSIPEKYREAVLNDASSSIIEVLKGQIESGRIKDLIKYFQLNGISNNSLVTAIVNRFANKLNKFYGIDPSSAYTTATNLIPPVMQQLIQQTKNKNNKELVLSSMLSTLNGNHADLSSLVEHFTLVA